MKKIILLCLVLLSLPLLAACGQAAAPQAEAEPFVIGAIPDQDPELLQRQFGLVADYLSNELGVPVEYKPVTDYAASVTAFRVGDLDMVWFGGLTGVQARLQVDGAQALVQRTIDEQFHSVFIASTSSGIEPFDDIDGLAQLKGHTFTFGSESSTSGRLMPQYFLGQAGVSPSDFTGGEPASRARTMQPSTWSKPAPMKPEPSTSRSGRHGWSPARSTWTRCKSFGARRPTTTTTGSSTPT